MSKARKRLVGWLLAVPAALLVAAEIPDPTPSPGVVLLGAVFCAFGAALVHENWPARAVR